MQSYATDEVFATGGISKLLSMKRGGYLRQRSERVSETGPDTPQHQVSFQHQVSLQRQASEGGRKPQLQRQISEKKQSEWDKEIPEVKLTRVFALNAKEWWIILLGLLGALVNGSMLPFFSIIFGEILFVFSLPTDQVLDEIHLWAGLFILLGVVSGLGQFLKVGGQG